jgi:serine/threonine protein kinase
MYSKPLRDLIGKMLSVKPSNRPTIVDILSKSFVRKRVVAYINEMLEHGLDLAPTDVDDMFADGLREQAEKLQIPGFFDDSGNAAARLMRGKRSSSCVDDKGAKPIKTQLE